MICVGFEFPSTFASILLLFPSSNKIDTHAKQFSSLQKNDENLCEQVPHTYWHNLTQSDLLHDRENKMSQTIKHSTSCKCTDKIIQQVLSVNEEQHEKVTDFSILTKCFECTNFTTVIEFCSLSTTKDTNFGLLARNICLL